MISDRNARIVDAYVHDGLSQRACADRFGVSPSTVRHALRQGGYPPGALCMDRRRTRNAAMFRQLWADPEWRAKQVDAARQRMSVWPDCPDHLRDDYDVLRKYMTARAARELLEATA